MHACLHTTICKPHTRDARAGGVALLPFDVDKERLMRPPSAETDAAAALSSPE